MKKRTLLFGTLALLTLCISCQKTQNPVEPEKPIDFGNFKFNSEFSARDSKTEWVKNEKIFIFWDKGSTEAAAASDGKTAEFPASIDSAKIYFALYPSTTSVSYDKSTAIVSYTVAEKQGGYITRTGLSYASATLSNPSFKFQSIIPTFKFKVDREDATSVFLRLVSGEAISGKVDISFKGQQPSISAPFNTAFEIEVSVDGSGTYYVATLPGIDISKGVLMRYSKNGEYFPATLVENLGTVSPSEIKDLGAVGNISEIKIANAEDVLKMRDMLHVPSVKVGEKAQYDSLGAINRGWIVNGMTFKIEPGTYYPLGTDAEKGAVIDMEYWYYGDLYDSPVKVAIEGSDPSQCIFSGGVDQDKTKGTGLFKVQDYAGLDLKNLTLCDTYRPGNVKGGAIQISSKTKCSATVENCVFNNNNVLENGGGAIGLVDGGILEVKDSKFTNNTAANGGVIYSTAVSNISFENCEFDSNNGTGTNGPSCVMLWGNAVAKFNKCTFTNNRAVNRAVINSQGTSVLFVNGCSFVNNSNTKDSSYASAIHAYGNFAGINNCTFYQNNTKSDNKPLNNSECISAGTDMIVSNCTFYEYFQANRGVLTGLTKDKNGYLFNNIVLNTYSGTAFYFSSAGYTFKSYGHNIYRNVTDYRTGSYKIGIPTQTGDIPGVAATILENGTFDSTEKVYKWSGNLTSGTLVKAEATEFETCVKAFETALTNSQLAGVQAGDAFWSWITDLGVEAKDQLGNSRGQNNWWPGSYQFN